MAVIEVRELRKAYGDVQAVRGVSFTVEQGEVFGMLGPNGAGKTTTVEILEGLRKRDGGEVTVLGLDPDAAGRSIKSRIGVQLQQVALYPRLRVHEVIELFASFYGRSGVADRLIQTLGLEERREGLVKDLSGGQQQRLSVALAVVNDPEIVFLDEPTTGMDPAARRNLWELIRQFHADGRTVVLTTHYIEEAEALCDRVAIMDSGRIIALDTPANLVRSLNNPYTIKLVSSQPLPSDEIEKLAWKLQPIPSCDGHAYELRVKESPQALSWLLEWAATHQVNLEHLVVITATLEDVFLELTGKELRD